MEGAAPAFRGGRAGSAFCGGFRGGQVDGAGPAFRIDQVEEDLVDNDRLLAAVGVRRILVVVTAAHAHTHARAHARPLS